MIQELHALLNGTLVGVIEQHRGRLRFSYSPEWRERAETFPLSLSMPLAQTEHLHAAVNAFLWGLLPDNERTLERLAKQHQVSAGSAFALLAQLGEDCAGALQLVRPERLKAVVGAGPGSVEWLTESDVAGRLRLLAQDPAAIRLPRDTGQFSLAGAQPKTALLFDGKRWGVPAGRTPTTHILKPPLKHLDGHLENEHLCLALARAVGLPAARSHVETFGEERAIVIERYDRLREARARDSMRSPTVLRLHQEDICQALGFMPALKYQNDGGPSPVVVVDLLRTYSSRPTEDVSTFLDALVFNWLIAGTDAHAKNYSLLLGSRGQVRLAPLYDLGSALPYPELDQRRLKLAMKLGSTYKVALVGRSDFRRMAAQIGLEESRVIEQARATAAKLLSALPVVFDQARQTGLVHPSVDRLALGIEAHARRCSAILRD